MGALLVTLLHCRSDHSLYPNVCATQARLSAARQPCSVPLLTYGAHSALLYGAEAAANANAVAGEKPTVAAIPHHSSSDLDGSPGDYEQHQSYRLTALHPPSKRRGGGAEGGAAADGGDGDADDDAAPSNRGIVGAAGNPTPTPEPQPQHGEQQQLVVVESEEQEKDRQRLLAGLTSRRQTSESAEEAKRRAANAMYRYTLPGAAVTAESGAVFFSPSSSATTHGAAGQSLRSASTQPPPLQHSTAELSHDGTQRAVAGTARLVDGPAVSAGDGVRETRSCDDVELGTMDCADAFQYYFLDEEGAYRDVESAVYVAPQLAGVGNFDEAVKKCYLHRRVALKASGSRADGTVESPSDRVVTDGSLPDAHHSHVPINLSSTLLPTTASAFSATPLHDGKSKSSDVFGSPLHLLRDSGLSPRAPSQPRGEAASADAALAGGSGHHHHHSDRFVSLVEEMYLTCQRVGQTPFVCWRSIDRVAPLREHARRLFRPATNSALQNARGEVEDDVSFMPGCSADESDLLHRHHHYHHQQQQVGGADAGGGGVAAGSGSASSSPSVCYLGPQQYLTASVWWSRVEAFGFGLRSIGLQPGDFFGIVEDTRYEWLITCFAAWHIGLVVVAFDSSPRTLRRVAMDTRAEMKAIVCGPHAQRALRRCYRQAALAAAAAAAAEDCDGDAAREGPADVNKQQQQHRDVLRAPAVTRRDAEPHRSSSVAEAAAGTQTPEGVRLAQQQQRHRERQELLKQVPLFIVLRSAAPLCAEQEGHAHDTGSDTSHKKRSQQQQQQPQKAAAAAVAAIRAVESEHSATDSRPGPQRRSSSSRSSDQDPHEDEEEEEEEEALWWSDVLLHGEAKLTAWRTRKAREHRQQQQQRQKKQTRLRLQQLQQQQAQQYQRGGRGEAAPLGLSASQSGADVGGVAAAGGSRDGSAVSTNFSGPTLGWATSTAFTSAATPTSMAVSSPCVDGGGLETLHSGSPSPPFPQSKSMAAMNASGASMPASAAVRDAALASTPRGLHKDASSSMVGPAGVAAASPSARHVGVPDTRTPSPPRHAGQMSASFATHTDTTAAGGGSGARNFGAALQAAQPPARGGNGSAVKTLASSSAVSVLQTQLPLAPLRPDDLAFVLYTSGEAKGVMLTHGALKASMAAHHDYLDTTDIPADEGLRRGGAADSTAGRDKKASTSSSSGGGGTSGTAGSGAAAAAVTAPSGDERRAWHYSYAASLSRMPALRSRTAPAGRPTYLAYLPSHHVAEFITQTTLLVRGVLVCYGSRRTLFDAFARPHGDLTEYRPTVFAALPATLARLHRAVQAVLSSGYRTLLFNAAYEARRQAMRRGLQSPFALSTIFAQPRELLGGRCRLVLARGAPLHPRDHEYVQVVCGVSVAQHYGPAELGGCGLQQAYCSSALDSLGGPLGPVQVKLRDVGSVWTHQAARPTGELLLRSPTAFVGYYRQPEMTAEVLEKGGWVHTRCVAERCPDGAFRLVSSLRQHVALNSNGHVMDLEYVESQYARHPLCIEGGVCLLVHPYRRYVCALILTSETRVRAFVKREAARCAAAVCDAGGPVPCPHGHSHPHPCGDRPIGEANESGSHNTASVVGFSMFSHAVTSQAAAAPQPPPQAQPTPSPDGPAGQLHEAKVAALARAMREPGWWPRCLREAPLNAVAAQSLAAWAANLRDEDGFVALAAHERVRHVRLMCDVWEPSRHTRTATGRLYRQGIHSRYSSLIYDLFSDPD